MPKLSELLAAKYLDDETTEHIDLIYRARDMEERMEKLNEYQFVKLNEICHRSVHCDKRFYNGEICFERRRELGFVADKRTRAEKDIALRDTNSGYCIGLKDTSNAHGEAGE